MEKSRISYRVPYADTDQMGVVYYANYFVYFERLRNELLRDLGCTYGKMEVQDLQLPVIEAHCDYKLPVRYDDLIEITGWVAECRGAKFTVHCEVHRDGELLASGHTIHACVTIATRKPRRLPPELTDQLMDSVRGAVH